MISRKEAEDRARQEDISRSQHYLHVYNTFRRNVELKRKILKHEQLIAETGFETPEATTTSGNNAAVAQDDDVHDDEFKPLQLRGTLPEKLASGFSTAKDLHRTLLEQNFPNSVVFSVDEPRNSPRRRAAAVDSPSAAAAAVADGGDDDPSSRQRREEAQRVLEDARKDIEVLEERILELAAKKQQLKSGSAKEEGTSAAAADDDDDDDDGVGNELEAAVSDRFARVTRLIGDLTAKLIPPTALHD